MVPLTARAFFALPLAKVECRQQSSVSQNIGDAEQAEVRCRVLPQPELALPCLWGLPVHCLVTPSITAQFQGATCNAFRA